MYPPIPRNEWVRAICVRADKEIITKSMNLVSAKTDKGNHVPKGGRLNQLRPRPCPRRLETSEAGVVKLMVTPMWRVHFMLGTMAPACDDQKRATVGQHGTLDLPEIDLKFRPHNEVGLRGADGVRWLLAAREVQALDVQIVAKRSVGWTGQGRADTERTAIGGYSRYPQNRLEGTRRPLGMDRPSVQVRSISMMARTA